MFILQFAIQQVRGCGFAERQCVVYYRNQGSGKAKMAGRSVKTDNLCAILKIFVQQGEYAASINAFVSLPFRQAAYCAVH